MQDIVSCDNYRTILNGILNAINKMVHGSNNMCSFIKG